MTGAAQPERWSELDPLLPAAPEPVGDLLEVRQGVRAHLQATSSAPDDPALLSAASDVLDVTPVIDGDQADGLAALLPVVLSRAAQLPGRACTLSWPSRDVAATRVLLDAGMAALSVIAVAAPLAGAPSPVPAGISVRAAGPADLGCCVELVLAERAYSVLTGPAVARPGDEAVLRAELTTRLSGTGTVWLAEQEGRAVGVLDGGLVYAAPTSWLATRVPLGIWGATHQCGVLAAARGVGVGRALVEHAHATWAGGGAQGAVVYYHPANPLSSVFWPRRGYRPLWTVWEHRPPSNRQQR